MSEIEKKSESKIKATHGMTLQDYFKTINTSLDLKHVGVNAYGQVVNTKPASQIAMKHRGHDYTIDNDHNLLLRKIDTQHSTVMHKLEEVSKYIIASPAKPVEESKIENPIKLVPKVATVKGENNDPPTAA